jgi:tetratricopeptide (TPR) repeat protein
MNLEKYLKSIRGISLYVFLLSLLVLSPLSNFELYSQTKTACEENLELADTEYRDGNWNDAINLINQCLAEPDISESEKGQAYRLLGLVYIAIELEKEANEAVKNLLILVPNYKIDPENDPPQLKKIIDDITLKLKPSITNITPDNADVEGEGFTLTVNGSDFVYGSKVQFNGAERVTTYLNSGQLTAEISASDLLHAGEYDITVFSPIENGKISNPVKFSVNESSNALTWILIGGGAVVAAVVAVIALGGNGDGDGTTPPPPAGTFPAPPGRP